MPPVHHIDPDTLMVRVMLQFNIRGQDDPRDAAMFATRVITAFPTAEVWLSRHNCQAYVMIPGANAAEGELVPNNVFADLQRRARVIEDEYNLAFDTDAPYRPFGPGGCYGNAAPEVNKLAAFIERMFPEEYQSGPGFKDKASGESAVDVAIRLLERMLGAAT